MANTRDASARVSRKKSEGETTSASELLTVHEVARLLRVDDTTVRRWIKTGALEAVTLPHQGKRKGYRVRRRTLDLLMNSTSMPV